MSMRQGFGLLAMPVPYHRLLLDLDRVAQLGLFLVLRPQGATNNLVPQQVAHVGRDMLPEIVDPGAGTLVGTRHLQDHGVAHRCSTEVNLSP